jgi:hypothetical protein
MIKIKIGPDERKLEDASESWINQQINRLRKEQERVCVRVRIKHNSVNVLLASRECAPSGGIPRPPNPKEEKILDLWEKRGLNSPDFHAGQVIAFLKQVRTLLA